MDFSRWRIYRFRKMDSYYIFRNRVLLISTLSDFSTLDNVKDTGMYYISSGAFSFGDFKGLLWRIF